MAKKRTEQAASGDKARADGDGVVRFDKLVDLDLVDLDARTHRDEPTKEEIGALADSIMRNGLMQPIGVVAADGGRYRLVWGHRRLLALRALGRTETVAVVCVGSEVMVQDLRAAENFDRDDLHPLEIARAIACMVDAHAEAGSESQAVAVIAARLGRSEAWVRSHMVLARLQGEARELTAAGHLPLRYAREIAKLASEDAQTRIAQTCFASQWTGRKMALDTTRVRATFEQVQRLVKAELRSLKGVGWELDVPFGGGPECSTCPSNSVNTGGLFDAEGDTPPERATCLNGKCYEAKERAVRLSIDRALKGGRVQKAIAALGKDAGDATPADVRSVTPKGVRETTFARQVAQRLGTKKKAKPAAKQARGTSESKTDPTRDALKAWCEQRNRIKILFNEEVAKRVAGEDGLRTLLAIYGLSMGPGVDRVTAYGYRENEEMAEARKQDRVQPDVLALLTGAELGRVANELVAAARGPTKAGNVTKAGKARVRSFDDLFPDPDSFGVRPPTMRETLRAWGVTIDDEYLGFDELLERERAKAKKAEGAASKPKPSRGPRAGKKKASKKPARRRAVAASKEAS